MGEKVDHVIVTLLVTVLGMGSWVSVGGMWNEIPVLIAEGMPERYDVHIYITAIVQMTCIVLVAFLVCNHFAHACGIRRLEIPWNYVITFLGALATFLLIFLWDARSVGLLGGQPHSTGFFSLVTVMAIVDVTSVMTFPAFISILKSHYINWLYLGVGLGPMLPACIVLIQTSGDTRGSCVANFTFINESLIGNVTVRENCTSWGKEPFNYRFGPEGFFGFLFAMMFLCFVSYICLNTLSCAKREYAPVTDINLRHDICGGLCQSEDFDEERLHLSYSQSTSHEDTEPTVSDNALKQSISRGHMVALQVLYVGVMCIMYGIMSPIQGFSARAYGYGLYTLIVPLTEIMRTAAFLLFLLKPIYSNTLAVSSFMIGAAAAAYCFAVALMSPHPPLHGSIAGEILIVSK